MKREVVDAWRWFTLGDALAWALDAYREASRRIQPPPDEPEPETWAHGGVFVDEFHRALTLRLNAEAQARGLPTSGSASELLGWDGPELPEYLEMAQRENRPQNAVREGTENAS